MSTDGCKLGWINIHLKLKNVRLSQRFQLEQLEKEASKQSFSNDLFGELDGEDAREREAIKIKIANLISKIDDHLRS